MKVLVTGSGGFIAGHLIEVLRERGFGVVGLQRHIGNTQAGEEVRPDILYVGDIRDKEAVDKAVSISDGVIHLAGILGTQETVNNPFPSVEVNILGALNVLESVRNYKIPMVQIAVGNHWMNNSYSITKTTAERLTLMYAKEHGVKANVVRALNAFGERQKWYPVRKMMPSFISRALKGEDIQVYGDGSQEMDFVYVKDVANILTEALLNEDSGQLYEAGTGLGLPVRTWAEKIISLAGSDSKIEHLPMRPGETVGSRVVSDNPYPYEYTDTDKALEKVISWYRDHV